MGLLIVIGVCMLGGVLGAWLFQRLRIPQVVGYIVIGVLLGQTGMGLIDNADIVALKPVNMFALGLIGFLVGGELHGSTFKRYGRQLGAILMGEGLAAFLLVALPSTLIIFACCQDWTVAVAGGVVLGSIASATDPASTIDVLWEYRTAGILTTTIIAVVALDDALAMTLYAIGTSVAHMLVAGDANLNAELLRVGIEIFGSIMLGVLAGVVLNMLLRFVPQNERRLGMSLGFIVLTIGVAVLYRMDVILATMTIGVVLTNLAPRRSHEMFEVLRTFSSPIYILFFVLVGARLDVRGMPAWIWGLVFVYVAMRSIGKWSGAYIGGRLSKMEEKVPRLLGFSLFAQGGVAVGLSIVAAQHLQGIAIASGMSLGDMVVFTVTATTLIVQLIGPPCTKMAVRIADETGRNITEQDIVQELRVGDVLDRDVRSIPENMPLSKVIARFANDDAPIHPVVGRDGEVRGVLTFEALKDALMDPDSWQWILASDVMEPMQESSRSDRPLAQALDDMAAAQVEAMPVLESADSTHIAGILDRRRAKRRIRELLIRRRCGD